jgi:hypothetical protein
LGDEFAAEVKQTGKDEFILTEKIVIKIIEQAHKFHRIPILELVIGKGYIVTFKIVPAFVAKRIGAISVTLPFHVHFRNENFFKFSVDTKYKQYQNWVGGRHGLWPT